jgi:hypothetical protein
VSVSGTGVSVGGMAVGGIGVSVAGGGLVGGTSVSVAWGDGVLVGTRLAVPVGVADAGTVRTGVGDAARVAGGVAVAGEVALGEAVGWVAPGVGVDGALVLVGGGAVAVTAEVPPACVTEGTDVWSPPATVASRPGTSVPGGLVTSS